MYKRNNPTANFKCFVGAGFSYLRRDSGLSDNNIAAGIQIDVATLKVNVATPTINFHVITRDNSTTMYYYNNGRSDTVIRAVSSNTNEQFYVLAINTADTPGNFCDANLSGITVGSYIPFDLYTLMYSDWQTFQTALGRQV